MVPIWILVVRHYGSCVIWFQNITTMFNIHVIDDDDGDVKFLCYFSSQIRAPTSAICPNPIPPCPAPSFRVISLWCYNAASSTLWAGTCHRLCQANMGRRFPGTFVLRYVRITLLYTILLLLSLYHLKLNLKKRKHDMFWFCLTETWFVSCICRSSFFCVLGHLLKYVWFHFQKTISHEY